MTEDKDFGEWVFAHQVAGISVLFLRYDFKDRELMKGTLIKLLSDRLIELLGHFTTLTVQKMRSRKI